MDIECMYIKVKNDCCYDERYKKFAKEGFENLAKLKKIEKVVSCDYRLKQHIL